jgi:hypothetical protein
MKRSSCVRLVVLGSSVGVVGCGSASLELHQQHYETLEQCLHDWGDPADCKRSSGGNGNGNGNGSGGAGGSGGGGGVVVGGGQYYGPRYYWDYGTGRPVVVGPDGSLRSVGSARVTSEGSVSGGETARAGSFTRGGFGSMGHGGAGE